ncbi:MAG: TonB-dependent receptor [Opitutae bacterium]|nr:TonB-dependent receptor [Opitutae bacterium]
MNARSEGNLLAALALFAGIGFSTAVAQEATAAGEKKNETVKLEKFEVTGSRIKRVDAEGPSPLRIMTRQDIESSGRTNLTELLRELPETSAIGINEGGTITAVRGSTALDLRALGANNTLVIVNGRRQVLTGSNSGGTTFVDLNRYPVAMIERIEILKDGASAIYGSDATAGVVNIITRKDYTGFELSTSYGNTFDTDVNEKTISLFGGAASGKASLTIGLNYFERGALAASDRDFSANADLTARFIAAGPEYADNAAAGFYDGRSGTGNQARVTIRPGQVNGVNGVNIPGVPVGTALTRLPGTGGVVPSGAGALLGTLASATPSFTTPFSGGTGGAFNAAAAATYEAQRLTAGQAVSNLFNFQPFVWLVPATERTGLTASFRYDLTDNIEAYMSLGYQHNHSETHLAPSPISTAGDNQIIVPKENFYNPFGVDLNFNYRPTEVGPRIANITSNTYTILTGARGTLKNQYDWDIGYSYGRDETVDVTTNALSESRVRAALARTDATAFNIFGGPNFKNNANTIDSIRVTSQKGGSAELNLFDAKISGPLFDIESLGEVKGAVYAEYRTENFNEANDAISTTLDDIIGQVKLASSTAALRNVKSVAAEISLPLVKGKSFPFIYDLSLNVAARFEKFSDGYDSGVKPYYGLRYQPIKSLLLRASYTETFRAPTLPQLFGGVRESLPNGLPDFARPQALTGDPFDGSSTQRLVKAGGNPNLTPETAESFQFGFIYDVPFKRFEGLSIEATYGEIKQTNIITTTGTTFLRNNEFGDAAGLITRVPGTQTFTNTTANPITVYKGPGARLSPGADVVVQPGQSITVPGQILSLSDTTVNLALQRVRYYDFAVRYNKKTNSYGRFVASSTATYLNEYTFTRTPGSQLPNFVDRDGFPRFRIQTRLDWALKEYGAGITNNYIPEYGDVDLDGVRTTAYSLYNAYVSYQFSSKGILAGTRITVGVDNVFDEAPSLYWDSVGYDQSFAGRPQGRFAFISLKKEF